MARTNIRRIQLVRPLISSRESFFEKLYQLFQIWEKITKITVLHLHNFTDFYNNNFYKTIFTN